ncbi:MAG TPA: tetratricopeptide repeat protein [Planctomycetota bacterium]|nr:tetratricopeptide repeat protein [Planctomycetota bacterium]
MKRVLLLLLVAACSSATQGQKLDKRGQKQKNPDKAISDFTSAIELEPDHAEYWLHRGDARARQGDLAGAVADYSQSIKLEPTAAAHTHRARARERLHLSELALQDLGAALEIAPDYAPAYRTRAKIRAETGDAEGAKADEQKAQELE